MDITTILIIGGVAGAGYLAYRWGLAPKLDQAGSILSNKAVDGLTTAIDKKRMAIKDLQKLLSKQADAVTDLDAQVSTETAKLTRLKATFEQKVADVKDTQTAQPGNVEALQRRALAAGEAKKAVDRQVTIVDRVKANAERAHNDYDGSLRVFKDRKNELSDDEANVTLTRATTIGTSIAKQKKEFEDAAAAGAGPSEEIARALAKAEAEAKMHGESDDDAALRKARDARAADEILKGLGIDTGAKPAGDAPKS